MESEITIAAKEAMVSDVNANIRLQENSLKDKLVSLAYYRGVLDSNNQDGGESRGGSRTEKRSTNKSVAKVKKDGKTATENGGAD